jgi:hypothetical protein
MRFERDFEDGDHGWLLGSGPIGLLVGARRLRRRKINKQARDSRADLVQVCDRVLEVVAAIQVISGVSDHV